MEVNDAVWEVLEFEPTSEVAAIRKAYAKKLRSVHPEDDPEGFKALRKAYETALLFASLIPFSSSDDLEPVSFHHVDILRPRPAVCAPASAQALPDWTAVALDMLTPITSKMQDDAKVAAASLTALIASEELENIELRHCVEDTLLEQILSATPFPGAFVESILDPIGWKDAQFTLQEPGAISEVRRRLEGWHGYLRLLAVRDPVRASRPYISKPTLLGNDKPSSLQLVSAAILTGLYDVRRFYWLRFTHPNLTKTVINDINRLARHSPAALDWIDSRTVEWWQSRHPLPDGTLSYLFAGVGFFLAGIWGLAIIAGIATVAPFVFRFAAVVRHCAAASQKLLSAFRERCMDPGARTR